MPALLNASPMRRNSSSEHMSRASVEALRATLHVARREPATARNSAGRSCAIAAMTAADLQPAKAVALGAQRDALVLRTTCLECTALASAMQKRRLRGQPSAIPVESFSAFET